MNRRGIVDRERNPEPDTKQHSEEESAPQPEVQEGQVRTSGAVHVYDRPERSPLTRPNVSIVIVLVALVLVILLVMAFQLLHCQTQQNGLHGILDISQFLDETQDHVYVMPDGERDVVVPIGSLQRQSDGSYYLAQECPRT